MFSVSFFSIFTLSKLRFLQFRKCNLAANNIDRVVIYLNIYHNTVPNMIPYRMGLNEAEVTESC